MEKKKKVTAIIIGIIVIIVILFFVLAHMGKKTEFGGINQNFQIKTQDSAAGPYKYAITTYDAKDTNDQQIINFYNQYVVPLQKKNIYNCYVLEDGNDSIVISGSGSFLAKGAYDASTNNIPVPVLGEIKGNEIVWQKKDASGINPDIQIRTQVSQSGNYKYAITTYNAKDTSDQQIINFYNEKIVPLQGKDIYNCTLLDGNESILFAACSTIELGKGMYYINSDSMANGPIGEIKGDKIVWQK